MDLNIKKMYKNGVDYTGSTRYSDNFVYYNIILIHRCTIKTKSYYKLLPNVSAYTFLFRG